MKRFTKAEKDFMIKNKDMSFSDIAKILNRSPSSIRAYFNNLGIYHNRKFEPDLNEFIENYNKLTMCELMDLYNVSKKTLYKFLDENNIPRKNEIKRKELELRDKKKKEKEEYYSNIKHDYFEIIDHPQKAYYLGLLSSDGNINKKRHLVTITLQEEDDYILDNLYKELNINRKVTKEKGKYSRFQFSSGKMCLDLEKYGIIENKTWNMLIKNIPKEYYYSFLLGYFDGDGSIYSYYINKPSSYNISYCGSESAMVSICNMLDELNLKYSIKEDKREYKGGTFINVNFVNTVEKYAFLKIIYKNNIVYSLTRKREKSLKFIEIVENNETNRLENINAVKEYKKLCSLI